MEREYVIVKYVEMGVEQKYADGLLEALVTFRQIISKDIDGDYELYRLKEGWTDLDADNVEEFPIFTFNYEDGDDLYVAEVEDVIFAIQNLEEAKKLGYPIKVSRFSGSPEDFFVEENWIDYWEETVLEIK